MSEFSSKLEERYTSKYDKRFRKVIADGKVFDPLLNRYVSILRYLRREIGAGKRPSLFARLKKGCKIVNDSKKYNFSEDVKQIYGIKEWEQILEHLCDVKFPYRVMEPIGVTEDGKVKKELLDGTSTVVERINGEYEPISEGVKVLSWHNQMMGEVNDVFNFYEIASLFDNVEEEIARVSYDNIVTWEIPEREYETPYNVALKAVKYFRDSGNSFNDFTALFKSRKINEIMSVVMKEGITGDIVHQMLDDISKPLADIVNYLVLPLDSLYHERRRREAVKGNRGTPFSNTSLFGDEKENYFQGASAEEGKLLNDSGKDEDTSSSITEENNAIKLKKLEDEKKALEAQNEQLRKEVEKLEQKVAMIDEMQEMLKKFQKMFK